MAFKAPDGILGLVPSDDNHGGHVIDAIREGLWPFKPRTVNLFFDYDIDANRYVLFAEVWFPDAQFRHRVSVDAWALAGDVEAEMYKAARQMFEGFRYREDDAISNNIVLGEE